MKLKALLSGVPYVTTTAPLNMEITDLCFDSRVCRPGMAFACVKGLRADGHDYIGAALENGAALIIAKHAVDGVPTVVTDEPEITLAFMAGNFYGNPAREMTFIGVTGTKGKTSTTFFIKYLLEQTLGVRVGLIGTIRNMAGDIDLGESHNSTPTVTELHALLRQMRDAGCTHVVMEVSSHALALGRVDGIRFRVGVFTNLSQDHLDFHGTMENYLQAKLRLFRMSDVGVVNIDDPASARVLEAAACPIKTFSMQHDEADVYAKDVEQRGADGVDFNVYANGRSAHVKFPVPGLFSVHNALVALSAALELDAEFDDAVRILAEVPHVPGRAEVVPVHAEFRVIVDYAHSPDSVAKIVETVAGFTAGRVISVLGCGGDRDRTKRPKMADAAARGSDHIILTTDNPRFEEPADIIQEMLPGVAHTDCPYEVVIDRREAIRHALDLARPRDTVLIMGKGHEPYQEVCGVRHHFDDREEVLSYMAAIQEGTV